MNIAVQIPRTLRDYSRSAAQVTVAATTLRGVLEQLEHEHPELYRSVCDETGSLRRHINLFINSDLVSAREPDGMGSALQPGDIVSIFTAVSGG